MDCKRFEIWLLVRDQAREADGAEARALRSVVDFATRRIRGRPVGYLRIFSFNVSGARLFAQQVARILDPVPRTMAGKLIQIARAFQLEWHYTKDEILELYLNVVEFGPGLWGVEAASRAYFGVAAHDLSEEQAASLTATLPHPRSSNPSHRPGRMLARRALILARYRGGETKLLQFFVGQVMKSSRGKADPKLAQRVLEERLTAG